MLPGEPVEPSPLLPIEATRRIPFLSNASVAATMSSSGIEPPRDIETTLGASSVFGSPSGSMIHSMPPMTCASVPFPPGITEPTMSSQSGATPTPSWPLFPPAIIPAQWVPCPTLSKGSVTSGTILPDVSNVANFVTFPASSGCFASTPVSSKPTLTPWPLMPCFQRSLTFRSSRPQLTFVFFVSAILMSGAFME
ncbi:MAG: hypothetical protein BWX90_00660 [bacterium ADurb.Bin132]|nr:MAG: hypothetical protein BWX90_00660 [bacterium ADurb.Bin132]